MYFLNRQQCPIMRWWNRGKQSRAVVWQMYALTMAHSDLCVTLCDGQTYWHVWLVGNHILNMPQCFLLWNDVEYYSSKKLHIYDQPLCSGCWNGWIFLVLLSLSNESYKNNSQGTVGMIGQMLLSTTILLYPYSFVNTKTKDSESLLLGSCSIATELSIFQTDHVTGSIICSRPCFLATNML